MKQAWTKLAGKFNALNRRERLLVAVAALVVIGLLGATFLVEPLLARQAAARRQIDQQGAELRTLQAQVATMKSRMQDPDAANRAALERLRQEIGAIDARLTGVEKTLVPAERMPVLLEEMLKHNRGLRLAALRTLPVALVVERKAETDAAKNSEAGVFKHGVEITLHGGYADLLAYLAQIEGLPQQMFWSRLHLKVDAYPKITLTLTVYTLSLDRTWLVV